MRPGRSIDHEPLIFFAAGRRYIGFDAVPCSFAKGSIMQDQAMLVSAFAIAAFASLSACSLIVLTQRWHGGLSLDRTLAGKQKFHKVPVPRIGGAGMVLGVACACALAPGEMDGGVATLTGAALPVFAIGLAEDLTKRVSVRMRFALTLASGLLAWWTLDAVLPRLDLAPLDALLAFLPLALALPLTVVAVAGVTNAINIIDGFNGLAGSTAVAILAGTAFLGWRCGDALVLQLALLGIGAAAGFLLLNYPRGLLFMGDGGAYFLGFWCAESAVLLVCRNPSVSAWQVLALHAYPVMEVLYSIFRKKVLRGMCVTMPDRLHLHMLIYRRCGRRNAGVAALVAPWSAAWMLAVVTLGGSGAAAALLLAVHAAVYVAVYVRLLRGGRRLRAGAGAVIKRLARAARARAPWPSRVGR
jgi:UDP-N-acetylmuramyl pentapeptide phosphotransferase/UDP-N-acetylglucosamine-1-phosphate transferase